MLSSQRKVGLKLILVGMQRSPHFVPHTISRRFKPPMTVSVAVGGGEVLVVRHGDNRDKDYKDRRCYRRYL
jgi:hypothetical protein